jgi:hypothetical protein
LGGGGGGVEGLNTQSINDSGAARINLIKNKNKSSFGNRNEIKLEGKVRNYNYMNENMSQEYIEQLKSQNASNSNNYYNSINYEQNNFIDSILSTNNNNNMTSSSSTSNNEKHYDLENRRLLFKFKLGQQNQHLLLPDDDDDDDDDDIDNLKDSIDPSAFLP